MGILGLLQYLKNCQKERRLSHYHGKTAAVDTYAWYCFFYSGCIKLSRGPAGNNLSWAGLTDTATSTTAWEGLIKLKDWVWRSSWSSMGVPFPAKGRKRNPGKSKFIAIQTQGRAIRQGEAVAGQWRRGGVQEIGGCDRYLSRYRQQADHWTEEEGNIVYRGPILGWCAAGLPQSQGHSRCDHNGGQRFDGIWGEEDAV